MKSEAVANSLLHGRCMRLVRCEQGQDRRRTLCTIATLLQVAASAAGTRICPYIDPLLCCMM